MAWRQSPGGSEQHLTRAAAAARTRTQRPGKHLAVHASELVVKPDFQILRRYRRPLLLRLEHTHRPTLEDYVHRATRLGSSRSLNLRIGITLEIVKRLGIKVGTFAEIGVGNGLENNTLILLANGWHGFWIGAEDLAFNHKLNPKRFVFYKTWVTVENVALLIRQGFESVGINELDVLSLDVDGNDFYIARKLLTTGILPKLFILEYNAKFPPPIKWTIKYDANHSRGDLQITKVLL